MSIDPNARSGNLDYLLQDEEPKRGGALKFILIMIALALAAGLGYLRWKNQGLPGLGSGAKKPTPVAQSAGAPDTSAPEASAPVSSAPSTASREAPGASQPAGSAATTATTAAAPSTNPPANPSTPPAAANTEPAVAPAAEASGDAGAKAAQPPLEKTPPAADAAATPAANTQPATPPPSPRPAVRRVPPPRADPVKEAQKYIYGQGAPQDCDRGLRYLKPAADQGNPQAMIEMGALYSAGLCTPRDLPTAYRWFALALRKDPKNHALNADLEKLWGEMTQPERQLAIRLSQ